MLVDLPKGIAGHQILLNHLTFATIWVLANRLKPVVEKLARLLPAVSVNDALLELTY